jgi:hypothetical protein
MEDITQVIARTEQQINPDPYYQRHLHFGISLATSVTRQASVHTFSGTIEG